MKITQKCQVYINIFCDETEKLALSTWLKNYFYPNVAEKKMRILQEPIHSLEIVDDARDLIVIDLDVPVECSYEKGDAGSRWEPPTPACIEGFFEANDFISWINEIIPDRFDYEVEIDEDSYIPTEDEMLKDLAEEEYRYEEY